jgi:hypothetical protein
MDVIFVAKQSIVTSVTVLLLEHTVVELVVVRPVTSQPEIAVAWLVHVVLVALPAPVRMVQSLATWLAVIVSQPEVNEVIVEGWIEQPFRAEPVAVDVQVLVVLPSLAVEDMQYSV